MTLQKIKKDVWMQLSTKMKRGIYNSYHQRRMLCPERIKNAYTTMHTMIPCHHWLHDYNTPLLKKVTTYRNCCFPLVLLCSRWGSESYQKRHKFHCDSNIATFGSLRIAQRDADVDQEWRVFEMILWILWSSVRRWRWGRSMCHQALIVDGLFGHGCG